MFNFSGKIMRHFWGFLNTLQLLYDPSSQEYFPTLTLMLEIMRHFRVIFKHCESVSKTASTICILTPLKVAIQQFCNVLVDTFCIFCYSNECNSQDTLFENHEKSIILAQ